MAWGQHLARAPCCIMAERRPGGKITCGEKQESERKRCFAELPFVVSIQCFQSPTSLLREKQAPRPVRHCYRYMGFVWCRQNRIKPLQWQWRETSLPWKESCPLCSYKLSGDQKPFVFLTWSGDELSFPLSFQSTPLHLAAGYNRVRIVQLLLQHGADVHAKDKG